MMDGAIQWAAILAHDLTQFVIILGLVSLIVNVSLSRWLADRRLQNQRVASRQLGREVSCTLLTVIIFSGMGWMVHFGPLRPFMRLYTELCTFSFGVPGLDWAYLFVSLAVTIILHDAYFYWTHRLIHHRLLCRHIHRLHHRSITPAPTTAYAFASGEALLHALFLPLILLVVPLHPIAVGLFMVVMIARNTLAHTGIEVFPPGFASGRWRWSTTVTHHEHGAGNYGFYFTWWDRLMGTERADYVNRFRAVTDRQPSVDFSLVTETLVPSRGKAGDSATADDAKPPVREPDLIAGTHKHPFHHQSTGLNE